MDLEPLLHRAQAGDVKAFVELTRGYQHLAFGSALALVHDSAAGRGHRPGGISRRLVGAAEARRAGGLSRLAAGHRAAPGLSGAAAAPSRSGAARRGVGGGERRADAANAGSNSAAQAASALAAIAGLPAPLREPATLVIMSTSARTRTSPCSSASRRRRSTTACTGPDRCCKSRRSQIPKSSRWSPRPPARSSVLP